MENLEIIKKLNQRLLSEEIVTTRDLERLYVSDLLETSLIDEPYLYSLKEMFGVCNTVGLVRKIKAMKKPATEFVVRIIDENDKELFLTIIPYFKASDDLSSLYLCCYIK